MEQPIVFVALLAKQKAQVLNYFLETLDAWDYPKDRIHIYIRTNNNTDNTEEILADWIGRNAQAYRSMTFETENVAQKVENLGVHEWTGERFRVLAKIRQESLRQCLLTDSDYYFVVDLDNFLYPDTLKEMVKLQLPVVAPLLRYAIAAGDHSDTEEEAKKIEGHRGQFYANYHHLVDDYGSIVANDVYYKILDQTIKGLIECDCVHCTYLIKREYIEKLNYTEESDRWEYMVFSESARKQGIPQYLDNRRIWGVLTLTENEKACRWWMDYLKDPATRTDLYRNRVLD
jgi:hypothetical protein